MNRSIAKLLESIFKWTGLVLSLLIVCNFIYIILNGPLGLGLHLDSCITVFEQFGKYWLNKGLIGKIGYLTEASLWPHPKIFIRIGTIISYYTTGEVSMKFIDLLGNLGLILSSGYLFKEYFYNRNWFLYTFPIGALLLITTYAPLTMPNFWTVLIMGVGYHLILSLAAYKLMLNEKHFFAIILLLLSTFRSGAGFIVWLPVFMFFIVSIKYKKKSITEFYPYLISAIVAAFILYFHTWDQQLTGIRMNSKPDINIFKKILSIILYGIQLTGSYFTSKAFLFSKSNIHDLIIGLIGLSGWIFLLLKTDWTNKKHIVLNASILHFFTTIMMIAVLSDNPERLNELSQDRYIFYSIFFWITLYTLCITIFDELSFIFSICLIPIIFVICLNTFKSFEKSDIIISTESKLLRKKKFYDNISGDVYSKAGLQPRNWKRGVKASVHNALCDGVINLNIIDDILNVEASVDSLEIMELMALEPIDFYQYKYGDYYKINVYVKDFVFDYFYVNMNDKFYRSNSENTSKMKGGFKKFMFYLKDDKENPEISFYVPYFKNRLIQVKAVENYHRHFKLNKPQFFKKYKLKHHKAISKREEEFEELLGDTYKEPCQKTIYNSLGFTMYEHALKEEYKPYLK